MEAEVGVTGHIQEQVQVLGVHLVDGILDRPVIEAFAGIEEHRTLAVQHRPSPQNPEPVLVHRALDLQRCHPRQPDLEQLQCHARHQFGEMTSGAGNGARPRQRTLVVLGRASR